MRPSRVSHSASIGPGVVPRGVDPDYDAEVAKEYEARKHVAHHRKSETNFAFAKTSSGRPFSIDPNAPTTRTQTPYVTGTSVLAIKYKDGVLMACDTLGCYGSTKRYKNIQRMKTVGKHTIVGFTGELSDFDYISTLLDELEMADFCQDDECPRTPKEIYNYLVRVMYNRRNKFDPLWNSLIVSGWDYVEKKPFLGCVGMIGQHYVDDHVATGFGNHLARPLFRESWKEDMTEQEAEKLLKSALLSCVMRDKMMMNKFQLSKVTADGPGEISEPFAIETRWGYENYVNPTKFAPGAW